MVDDEKKSCPIILKYPNEKMLEKMAMEEEAMRSSKEYQDKCTLVKDIPNGWLEVTAAMQKDIAIKNGFTDEMSLDVAVNMLRTAHIKFPLNDIFKRSLYVRNNKANKGTLLPGDDAPDVTLHDLAGTSISLHSLISSRKTIIISATGT
ncbi:MAG: hypothetical protein Harvfovirus65_4 [Harvfovirus sp.]|uniref:Uncharacterized protein n=1 Tax=Harvfovirus sp. TaxID=2487768 RepID=A0A3G5A3N1_9VIRU|nr:MAG: hypothetical protein Harvfovirus65_4 [Harvfovirus sp.]